MIKVSSGEPRCKTVYAPENLVVDYTFTIKQEIEI